MLQYSLNSIPVCTLLLLLLFLYPSPAACVLTPSIRQQEEESTQRERLIYFFLHIAGVVLAGIASATRVSYPPSICMDYLMTFVFYFCITSFLAISSYLTYQFDSPDMLLIGAAAGVIVAWRSFPRLWSTNACSLHWEAPMWRIREGEIYKRVRKRRLPTHAEDYWNGYRYRAELVNGRSIFELVEKEPYHWENSGSRWKTFIIRGRLGDQPARRAALAWRMAYTIPLPALISCGRSEYYAARGVLGEEVAHTWDVNQNNMSNYKTLSQNGNRAMIECDSRNELAIVLHLQMLLYQKEERHRKEDWTEYATEWLFGEIVTSSGAPWENVLACGKVRQDGDLYWSFVAKNDRRVMNYGTDTV